MSEKAGAAAGRAGGVEEVVCLVRERQKGTASEFVFLPVGMETEKALGFDTGGGTIWLPKGSLKEIPVTAEMREVEPSGDTVIRAYTVPRWLDDKFW